jgi:hypothetical protein
MENPFNSRKLLFASTLFVALTATLTYAGPNQMRRTGTPTYDPKTETTIRGVVQEVREVPGPGRSTGTHLTVKAGNDLYEVHMGPTWYLTKEKYAFVKGDQLEVTGSKVEYQDADTIIARQVKKDGKTWTLRDSHGIPLWSRHKNR